MPRKHRQGKADVPESEDDIEVERPSRTMTTMIRPSSPTMKKAMRTSPTSSATLERDEET